MNEDLLNVNERIINIYRYVKQGCKVKINASVCVDVKWELCIDGFQRQHIFYGTSINECLNMSEYFLGLKDS